MKKLSLAAILCSFLVLSSASTLAAQSGYYRWQDATGQLHYSQQPPKNQPYEFISEQRMPSRAADNEADEGDTATESDAESSSTEPEKMEILPAKDPALCEKAKGNMQSLKTNGARIRITNADGSTRMLNAEEMKQQENRAQQVIKLHCN